jgi:hypothetical protein
MSAEHVHHEHPAVHHETSDANINAVFVFAAGLTVVCMVAALVVWGLFRLFASQAATEYVPQYPMAITQAPRVPPEPRLQTNPREDLRELRAHEDALLATYGWVDRNAGVVRLPIDEAMKLTLERGLPARAGTMPPPLATESGDANSGKYVGDMKK